MEDVKNKEMQFIKLEPKILMDPKMLIIDTMKDNNLIYYVWISSLLLAGQCNRGGLLYLNSDIPYTYKTLAIVFRRTVNEIKKTFKVLIELEMIEVTSDEIFKIKNWDKHQSIDNIEKVRKQTKERVAKYRERKKEVEKATVEKNEVLEEVKSTIKQDNRDSDSKTMDKIICNVTENQKIGDVTQQNKKENKKKNKNKESVREDKSNIVLNYESTNEAVKLADYCEDITGRVGTMDIGALHLAIDMHGKDNVKRAIDKAIEVGKVNMQYINGILKNWRRDGYPKEDDIGGKVNGGKCNCKSDKTNTSEFKSIKPKARRLLTKEEQAEIEARVI